MPVPICEILGFAGMTDRVGLTWIYMGGDPNIKRIGLAGGDPNIKKIPALYKNFMTRMPLT